MTSKYEDCCSICGKELCDHLEKMESQRAKLLKRASGDAPSPDDLLVKMSRAARDDVVARVQSAVSDEAHLANIDDAALAIRSLRLDGRDQDADEIESMAEANLFARIAREAAQEGEDVDGAMLVARASHVMGRLHRGSLARALRSQITKVVRRAGAAENVPPPNRLRATGWRIDGDTYYKKALSRSATIRRQGAGPGWAVDCRDEAFPNSGRWVPDTGKVTYGTLMAAQDAADAFLHYDEGQRGSWLPQKELEAAGGRLRSRSDCQDCRGSVESALAFRAMMEQKESTEPTTKYRRLIPEGGLMSSRNSQLGLTSRYVPDPTARPVSQLRAAVRASVGLRADGAVPRDPDHSAAAAVTRSAMMGGLAAGVGTPLLHGGFQHPHFGTLRFATQEALNAALDSLDGNAKPFANPEVFQLLQAGQSEHGLKGGAVIQHSGLNSGEGDPRSSWHRVRLHSKG